jgi:hypothetical protein
MRIKPYILLLILFSFVLEAAPQLRADSQKSEEYQIKAAFIYNFIKFIDWPKEKKSDANEPITIGIIGSEDFIKAFEPVKGKKIKDRNISIKYFAGYEKLKKSNDANDDQWDRKMEALKVCNVLMFCSCHSIRIQDSDEIVKALKGLPVLTVGETEHFLESGGIIDFVIDNQKVCFEINNNNAKQAKLNIRSKLLRLAKKVIEEKTSDKTES